MIKKNTKITKGGIVTVPVQVVNNFNKTAIDVQNGHETCVAAVPVKNGKWKLVQYSSMNAMDKATKQFAKRQVMHLMKFDSKTMKDGYIYQMYVPVSLRSNASSFSVKNGCGKNAKSFYCEIC